MAASSSFPHARHSKTSGIDPISGIVPQLPDCGTMLHLLYNRVEAARLHSRRCDCYCT